MDTLTLNGDTISLTDTTFSSKSSDYDPVNKPVHYNLNVVSEVGNDITNSVQSIRAFFNEVS